MEPQLIKSLAVGVAFGVALLLQAVSPLLRESGLVARNWRRNLPLALLNTVCLATVCGGCACEVAAWAAAHGIGLLNLAGAGPTVGVAATLVTLDGVAYGWHRANHRWPLLWRFHAVHHTGGTYDASTAVRFHLGELVISLGVRLAVVLTLGLPVLGIVIFEAVYALFNVVEHGNIAVPEGVDRLLSRVLVTPAFHRRHHAPEVGGNFATVLALWDRAFGTASEGSSRATFAVGLADAPEPDGFVALLLAPFTRKGLPVST